MYISIDSQILYPNTTTHYSLLITELRAKLLLMFINWRNTSGIVEGNSSEEKVSINHVDFDGNTAIHLAAANNLLQCVSILISNGAIISIVNR